LLIPSHDAVIAALASVTNFDVKRRKLSCFQQSSPGHQNYWEDSMHGRVHGTRSDNEVGSYDVEGLHAESPLVSYFCKQWNLPICISGQRQNTNSFWLMIARSFLSKFCFFFTF